VAIPIVRVGMLASAIIWLCVAGSGYFVVPEMFYRIALTIFRLPPLLASLAVAPYLLLLAYFPVGDYRAARLNTAEIWTYTLMPLMTIMTGLLVCAVLREYYETIVAVAKRHGATVKDFAGDGASILVGAPIARADHAEAGLKLARELIVDVKKITGAMSRAGTTLGGGAGVASGTCAVGAIGSQSRLEYTAVGSAVNLASRLCSRCN
jgi:hypothetical protein